MPLEESFELDLSDALRGIDTIEDALTAAAQAFRVGIAEALDLLSTVRVESVDASAITTGIDEAVAAADLDAAVSADTSGITDAIDEAVAAADAETTVTVEASVDGVTDTIEQAIAEADATVEVEADTSAAEAAISDLGSTASEAAGGLRDVSGATDAIGGLSAASTGSILGLERGLDKLGTGGTVAAAGITAVALSAGELFKQALAADTADRRFAASLGEIADQISSIRIEGFADGLEELAERTGASDESMKLAAARIADLGNSAEASQDEIAGAAENILLLATRASVLNPTLGEAGAVADGLTNALARGGRALAPYGISLSAAAIQARAVADAGGDASAATDRFALSAAGAVLVTEQLGDRLKTDIVEGAKGTEIQLRSLQEQFGNALELFGRPLLEPVLEAAREGQPILLELAGTFGELATTILPLVVDGLRIAAPIIATVADVVSVLLSVLDPILAVLGAIPDPVLQAVGTFVVLRTALLALGPAAASAGIGFTLALGPLALLAAAVGTAVSVFASLSGEQDEAKGKIESLTQAFADQAEAIRADTEAAVAKRIADEDQGEALRQLGLSVQEFADLAGQGEEGFNRFLAALERSGQITPEVAAAVREQGGATELLSLANEEATGSNLDLVESFVSLANEAQNAARAQLTNLVNTEQLTEAQRRSALETTRNADGTVNYVSALESVEDTMGGVVSSTEDGATATAAFADTLEAAEQRASDAETALEDLFDAQRRLLTATIDSEEAHIAYGDALDEVARTGAARFQASLEDQREAAEAAEDALDGLLDAQIGFIDSSLGAESANRRFTDALAELNEQAALLGSGDAEKAAAAQAGFAGSIRGVRDAALDAAKADLRLAESRAEAEGGTLTAAQRQATFAESLRRVATEAAGPAQQAILDLVASYEALPKEAKVELTTDTSAAQQAQNDYAEAVRGAREAALRAAEADAELAGVRAEAEGRIPSAIEKQNLFREALDRVASTATGPVKSALLEVIGILESIDPTREVELRVATDKAIEDVEKFFERFKDSLPTLSFDVRAGRSALPGGGGFPGAMAGGSFIGPGSFFAGEAGRELVTLQPAQVATVVNNRQTEALLSSSVALDPELSAAIRTLIAQPRTAVNLSPVVMPGADPYPLAVETVRQIESLAVRQSAGE